MTPRPASCERARVQSALAQDHELSRFERAARAAHLVRCPECRQFDADVAAFTRMLRAAPLQPLSRPIVVARGRSAWAALKLMPSAAVAVLALALVGTTGSLTEPERSATPKRPKNVTVYPTGGEIEQEISVIEVVSTGRTVEVNSTLR